MDPVGEKIAEEIREKFENGLSIAKKESAQPSIDSFRAVRATSSSSSSSASSSSSRSNPPSFTSPSSHSLNSSQLTGDLKHTGETSKEEEEPNLEFEDTASMDNQESVHSLLAAEIATNIETIGTANVADKLLKQEQQIKNNFDQKYPGMIKNWGTVPLDDLIQEALQRKHDLAYLASLHANNEAAEKKLAIAKPSALLKKTGGKSLSRKSTTSVAAPTLEKIELPVILDEVAEDIGRALLGKEKIEREEVDEVSPEAEIETDTPLINVTKMTPEELEHWNARLDAWKKYDQLSTETTTISDKMIERPRSGSTASVDSEIFDTLAHRTETAKEEWLALTNFVDLDEEISKEMITQQAQEDKAAFAARAQARKKERLVARAEADQFQQAGKNFLSQYAKASKQWSDLAALEESVIAANEEGATATQTALRALKKADRAKNRSTLTLKGKNAAKSYLEGERTPWESLTDEERGIYNEIATAANAARSSAFEEELNNAAAIAQEARAKVNQLWIFSSKKAALEEAERAEGELNRIKAKETNRKKATQWGKLTDKERKTKVEALQTKAAKIAVFSSHRHLTHLSRTPSEGYICQFASSCWNQAAQSQAQGEEEITNLWTEAAEEAEKIIIDYASEDPAYGSKLDFSAARAIVESITWRMKERKAMMEERFEEANLWREVVKEANQSFQLYQRSAHRKIYHWETRSTTQLNDPEECTLAANSTLALAKAMAECIDWKMKERKARNEERKEEANLLKQAIQKTEQAIVKYSQSVKKHDQSSAKYDILEPRYDGQGETTPAYQVDRARQLSEKGESLKYTANSHRALGQSMVWQAKEMTLMRDGKLEEANLWRQASTEATQASQLYQRAGEAYIAGNLAAGGNFSQAANCSLELATQKIVWRIQEIEAMRDGKLEEASLWQQASTEANNVSKLWPLFMEQFNINGRTYNYELIGPTSRLIETMNSSMALVYSIAWKAKQDEIAKNEKMEEANLWQQACQKVEKAMRLYQQSKEENMNNDYKAKSALDEAKRLKIQAEDKNKIERVRKFIFGSEYEKEMESLFRVEY